MELIVSINLDNAAFENAGYEVARILEKAGKEIGEMGVPGKGDSTLLFDINGNMVGQVEVREEE